MEPRKGAQGHMGREKTKEEDKELPYRAPVISHFAESPAHIIFDSHFIPSFI